MLAGSRCVLWSATEAMGTDEVMEATRGFANHCACCRDRQGKGTPGRFVSDVPFQDSVLYPLSPTHPSTTKWGVKASPWYLLPSPLLLPIFITNVYRHVLTPCPLGSWPGCSKVCSHIRARQKPLADVWRSGREGENVLHFICLCAFAFAIGACKLGSVPLRYSFSKWNLKYFIYF